MRKILLIIVAFIAAGLLSLTGMAKMKCQAAETYTVTFRAGNVGTFRTGILSESDQVHVTENYIKVKVVEGSSIAQVMATLNKMVQTSADMDYFFQQIVNVKTGYLLLSESKWGPAVSDTVEENKEYVLDYGTLVDPVEYKIQYVDNQTGNPIASAFISYGKEGDVIEAAPITIAGYSSQEKTQSFTLKKNGKNQVSMKYVAGNSGNTGTTIYQEVPGETIEKLQTRVTYVPTNANIPANANASVNVNPPANGNTPTNESVPTDANEQANVNVVANTPESAKTSESKNNTESKKEDDKTITPSTDTEEDSGNDSGNGYWKTIVPASLAVIAAGGVTTLLIRKRKK